MKKWIGSSCKVKDNLEGRLSQLEELVDSENWDELRRKLSKMYPYDLAKLISSSDKGAVLFRAMPTELEAKIFKQLDPRQQNSLLKKLTNEEAKALLAKLPPDDRTALFWELPSNVTRRLFTLLGPEELKEAQMLLKYPEKSVGSVMTPDYIYVRPNMTIKEVLKKVRKRGKDSETIQVLYVIDEDGKLLDDLQLRKVILAEPKDLVSKLMDGKVASISAFAPRKAAYDMIKQYDLTALPVVDSTGALVGIVTVDDLIDVAEEETTEDFHKIFGIETDEIGLLSSLKTTPIRFLYKRRINWLIILVFINVLSGAAIACFEGTIARVVPLVFFLPLLIDSGGNAGSQAATLVIRAMAIGDVKLRDWRCMFTKELAVSLALGVTMGIAVSVLGFVRSGYLIGLTAALSMILIVVLSSLIGMSLPFILTKIKRDPATASAPLITSIADIVGVLIYFSIATYVLGL